MLAVQGLSVLKSARFSLRHTPRRLSELSLRLYQRIGELTYRHPHWAAVNWPTSYTFKAGKLGGDSCHASGENVVRESIVG